MKWLVERVSRRGFAPRSARLNIRAQPPAGDRRLRSNGVRDQRRSLKILALTLLDSRIK